jgi:hypothetical protein
MKFVSLKRFQKNQFGKNLWKELVGNQVELLLRNNKRIIGAVVEVLDTAEGIQIQFKESGVENNKASISVFSKREIKYIDPFLK